jgi:hypothetical protein
VKPRVGLRERERAEAELLVKRCVPDHVTKCW